MSATYQIPFGPDITEDDSNTYQVPFGPSITQTVATASSASLSGSAVTVSQGSASPGISVDL